MPIELNELEMLKEPVEPDLYIVNGIIPPGVSLLSGHQKIGKSWLGMKLCLCASRGVDLWGYKTLHCKALYCCLEDTKRRIRKRYDALIEAADELQGTKPSGWLDFRFQCRKLGEGLVEDLEDYIIRNPECKLIVIDTLFMITPRMNDSPYASDYNNIVALKKFADQYEIAIVIIHHTRKMKAKDPFDEILGTTGLNGAADAMMILSRGGRSDKKGTLKITGRDLSDEEIELEFNDGDWRIVSDNGVGEDETLPDGDDPEAAAEGMAFMRCVLDMVGNRPQWEGTATDFSNATGGAVKNLNVVKMLKKYRQELDACGISFANSRSSGERGITIMNRNA